MPGLRLLQLTVGNGQRVTGTNVLVLTNGIVCGYNGGVNEVAVDIQLATSQSFVVQDLQANNCLLLLSHPVDLNGYLLILESQASTAIINFGAGTVGVEGALFGTGGVAVIQTSGSPSPAGNVQFSGCTSSYNINGSVRVIGNTILTLKKTCGFSINDRLEIATNAMVKCEFGQQFSPSAKVVVEPGGQLYENGSTGEIQSIGTLELRGNATVNSAPGSFVGIATNLIAYGTNGLPTISGGLSMNNGAVIDSRDNSVDLDIPATIAGGSFTKIGPGYVKFRGTNTFTGALTISEGAVDAYSATAFGSTAGSTVLAGGMIELLGVGIGAEPLVASAGTNAAVLQAFGTNSWAGPIELLSDLEVSSSTGPTTLSGIIGGPGDLHPHGAIRLSGASANTFWGTTYVNLQLDTLELQKSFGDAIVGNLIIGDPVITWGIPPVVRLLTSTVIGAGHISIFNNGLLDLNEWSDSIGLLTITGGAITTGAGSLTLGSDVIAGASATTATISGNVNLNGATRTITVSGTTATPQLIISAAITNGTLIKDGPGELGLSGNSTYAGPTTVLDGILFADSNNALGSAIGGTIVSNGATLWFGPGADVVPENLIINGDGFGGTNGALAGALAITENGNVKLGTASTINAAAGAQFNLNGIISGTGPLTKIGTGTLSFGGGQDNSYVGDTLVNAGVLQLAKVGGLITIPGHLIIGSGGISGTAATVRHLAGCSNTIYGAITVNRGSLYDLNGQFEDFTPLVALGGQPPLTLNNGGDVQTGTGRLTLPAGTTVVVDPLLNGTSTISGRLGLVTDAFSSSHTFMVNGPVSAFAGTPLTISAALEAAGGNANVIKAGGGEMRLTGNNTYTGYLSVNDGQVTLANNFALGAAGGGAFVLSNAVLALDGGVTITGEPLTLNSTAGASLVALTGTNVWNGTVALSQPSTINVKSGAALQVLNAFSGPGALTKNGPGTLVMGGSVSNTFTGPTTINEGTLVLSNTVLEGTINGPLVIGDGIGGSNADVVQLRYANAIHNGVPITINSSGLLDLSHLGNQADTVGSISGSGNLALGAASLLAGGDNSSTTFSGSVTGLGGRLHKMGTGTLTLTGTNSNTGQTQVAGGSLIVNGFQPQCPAMIFSAGTLGGSGTVGNIDLASGTLAPGNSPGILTCSNVIFSAADSVFKVELNGTVPGVGYDQLNVRGTVILGGAILNATLGFASAVSNTFTIINNDGTEAVTNTFNGLPQNATLNISGIPFRISYTGGTGNDVVLTQLLPLPTLAPASSTGTNLVFTWPTNYSGFTLESNTNLSTAVWSPVVFTPVPVGTNYVVTNSVTGPQKFFRLRSP